MVCVNQMSEVNIRSFFRTILSSNLLTFIYILLLTLIVRLPYFFKPAISWDESTLIIMGQSILDGQLPYIDLWDLKPPIAFLSYALFILILGKSIVAIRIAGAIFIVVTALLIYVIGKICGVRAVVILLPP